MRRNHGILFIALMAASCGPGENDPGPDGLTAGESKALDEAAEMLDRQRSPAADIAKVPAPLPPDPATPPETPAAAN